MSAFDQARISLALTTLEDLHVTPEFACTVRVLVVNEIQFTNSLAQFNCAYFQFNYHPEMVLPLSILQCWDQLLTDIRYEINLFIRSDTKRKSRIADVALSTDDLISITIFILLKSYGLWSVCEVQKPLFVHPCSFCSH